MSVVVGYSFPVDSRARALYTTAALIVGVIGTFAGQFWALFQVTPHEEGLGFFDAIYAPRLWRLTVKYLPATRKPVCLGTWSLVGLLSALLVVGGLGYWLPGKKRLACPPGVTKDSAKTLEDSLDDLADTQDITQAKGPGSPVIEPKETNNDPDVDNRPTVKCVVIGYIPANDGTLAGLVLATEREDRLRYAGIAYQGLPQNTKWMQRRLSEYVQPQPHFSELSFDAVWVKPVVICEIHQSGIGTSGELVDPSFKGFVD
jgi:hypothetical protein